MKLTTNTNYPFKSAMLSFTLLGRTSRVILQNFPDPKTDVMGIGSRTFEGRFVFFADYDKIELSDLLRELRYIQDKFELSTIYVFEMDRIHSYHAICLDTFSMVQAFDILQNTSCDAAFIKAPKIFMGREWILRIGKKGSRARPSFTCKLRSKYDTRVISSAHKLFLELHYKLDVRKHKKEDGHLKVPLIEYNTFNRVG